MTKHTPHKRRPSIGIVLGDLNGLYESAIFWSVYETLEKHDVDITACYTIPVASHDAVANLRERYGTMVNLAQFDCVIVIFGTIIYFTSPDFLKEELGKHADLKAITVSIPVGNYPCVTIDNYAGMRAMMRHLLDHCNHRRIAFVAGPSDNHEALERLRAYMDVCAAYELGLDQQWIVPGQFSELDGEHAVVELLDNRKLSPDCIVCANDDMAIGVMRSLQMRGIRIPEDIAITGFDNVPESVLCSPGLTTIHQPVDEIGRYTALAAIAMLNGDAVSKDHKVPLSVVVRGSCGAPSKHIANKFTLTEEEFAHRQQVTNQALQLGKLLEENSRYLAYSITPKMLADALTVSMRRVGISFCELYLFDDPIHPKGIRRLVFGHEQEWQVDHNTVFKPLDSFLSPASQPEPLRIINIPLQFFEGWFGICVVGIGPHESLIYESIRGQVGSAVKNLQFMSSLRQQNEMLEQRVLARTQQLEHLLAQKHDMLGIVAHDLRSPLTSIGLGVDVLKSNWERLPNDMRERQLSRLQLSAESMLSIVTRLLNENQRDDSGLVTQIEMAAVMPLVRTVVNQHRIQAESKQVVLQMQFEDYHARARLDKELFSMALANLLGNAVKFTFAETRVVVSVYKRRGHILVNVIDEGPGISTEDKAKMFGRSSRLSATPTAGESSSGMGLYITKKMVEAMGGTVSADCRTHKQGSIFTIALPSA